MRSLGAEAPPAPPPPLCSRERCAEKSSVTWLGSPPGREAQMGQTTSWAASECCWVTCSTRVDSVKP